MLLSEKKDFHEESYTGEQLVLINTITQAYAHIPETDVSRASLRKRLQDEYPDLFSVHKDILQESTTLKGVTPSFESIQQEKIKKADSIQSCIKEIKSLFPETTHIITSREKESESLIKNINNKSGLWFSDIYGVRIVPRSASNLVSTLHVFKEYLTNRKYFTLHTFAYDDSLMKSALPGSSIYYKAFHFYIPIGSLFIEIQIRTPSIDTWSNLHHELVYKPTTKASAETVVYVEALGEMSNVTDYFNMILPY